MDLLVRQCPASSQTHTLMHTCMLTHSQEVHVHTLTGLWTLLCTHHLYEAEIYPTIGNHNLPYLGLIQIHLGPFSLIMCIQWSNREATGQGLIVLKPVGISLLTVSHFCGRQKQAGRTVQLKHNFLIFLCVYAEGQLQSTGALKPCLHSHVQRNRTTLCRLIQNVCLGWAWKQDGQTDRSESSPQANNYITIRLGYIAHRGSILLLVNSRVI